MAIVAALLAGYGGASYAATGGTSGAAGPTDTEPVPEPTTPTPDPAPTPAPAPKPAPKPAPTPSPTPPSRPATVYQAPVTSTPRARYTPPKVTRQTKAKPVRHNQRKPHRRAKHVSVAPKRLGQVKHANVVRVGVVPTAAVATGGSDALRRTVVIAGIGFAAFLFLLVVTVPATRIRFTGPGRVVMDHETDLVLAGIGILLLTALLFAVTGTGS